MSTIDPTESARNADRDICAQPPERLENGSIGEPKIVAGGIAAVARSMSHLARYTGVVRGIRTMLDVNKVDGIDCPGCAWPEPENRHMAEFCENGAKAIAEEASKNTVGADFFTQHTVKHLSEQSDFWLGKQGRLSEPMVRRGRSEHYSPISWDNAFAMIADQLRALESPNEAIFYTSGRTSNEAAFLYQLFVRAFGTNNLPDCSNMCHESSGTGLGDSIGIGKGTVLLDDFPKADLILILGQNPGTNHPRMLTTLQKAKRAGATIVSINPLKEAGLLRFKHPQEVSGIIGSGTSLTDDYYQVKINGDVALLKGLMKAMLARRNERSWPGLDETFITSRTTGFDDFKRDIEDTRWDDVIRSSGISRERIEELAERCLRSQAMICCWAMGLTQHQNGVANVQSVANLLMLGGHFGRPGAGACPVRGHSNVQGDRTVGIWERPAPLLLETIEAEFGFRPPHEHGYDAAGAIEAMASGAGKVFFAMGGNYLSATPDTEYTAQALQNTRLTVHVSTKLNRSHLVTGHDALILPCLGRTDRDVREDVNQFVTVENSMGYVHASRGKLKPPSDQLLSEPDIVARLAAQVLGEKHPIDWHWHVRDYDRVRSLIGRTIVGFENFVERMMEGDGFYLPNIVREGGFGTPDGKAKFAVHPIPEDELAGDELMLMTIRSHDQYNTTIYGMDDRYRGISNERRVVFVNADDMARLGLQANDVVDIVGPTADDDRERIARVFRVVQYDIPAGCCGAYFPEANPVVPVDRLAEGSRTPSSKSIPVTLRKHQDRDEELASI